MTYWARAAETARAAQAMDRSVCDVTNMAAGAAGRRIETGRFEMGGNRALGPAQRSINCVSVRTGALLDSYAFTLID
jgi:hypothetical protein